MITTYRSYRYYHGHVGTISGNLTVTDTLRIKLKILFTFIIETYFEMLLLNFF